MTARTMILISDNDGSGRVRLLEFTDGHEAEQRLEQLIAEGVPQESIRAFNAVELEMQVSHRPVVSLNGAGSGAEGGAPHEPAPAIGDSEADGRGAAHQDADSVAEAEGEPPMIRDGVRFSSLFKPDGGLEPV